MGKRGLALQMKRRAMITISMMARFPQSPYRLYTFTVRATRAPNQESWMQSDLNFRMPGLRSLKVAVTALIARVLRRTIVLEPLDSLSIRFFNRIAPLIRSSLLHFLEQGTA